MTTQDALFGDEGFSTPGPARKPTPTGRRRSRSRVTAASPSDARVLDSLRAFVAPVAGDAGAVAEDPRVITLARALMGTFASRAYSGTLTKGEVLEQLRRNDPDLDESFFESRFALFVELGLLRPYRLKKHQPRYSLNPAGLVGLLVLERLGARGGIDELLHLLGSTRVLLENGQAPRNEVLDALSRSCQLLQVFIGELRRLIDSAPLEELIGEHTQQDPQNVTDAAAALNQVVTVRFGGDADLSAAAFDLLSAALEYRTLVTLAVERVLDQGGGSLDFSVLSAEQYLAAAIDADFSQLEQTGASLVVDPPMPWTHPRQVIDALDELVPHRRSRERPKEPAVTADADPLGRLAERAQHTRHARRTRAESRLQGGDSVDLTSFLRDAGWPAAAGALTEFLALSHDPDEPFHVEISEGLLIDTAAAVTYLHPTALRRVSTTDPGLDVAAAVVVAVRFGVSS